jgi:uncharacterized membrane protein YdjX (TVP38/TMEM64 family)
MTETPQSPAAVPEDELPEIDDEHIELTAVESGLSRELKRLLILLAGAAAIFALLFFTPIGGIVRDVQQIRDFLKGDDLWAELSFLAIVTLLVAIGMPRLIFYGVGGLAFGFWQGLLLAQAGSLLGSFATFHAIRHGGRGWLLARFGEHRLVKKAFRVKSSIKAVVLIRQLPLHGLMITGGLALSQVSAPVFLTGTFIGYLPQGTIATLIGSGMVDEQAMTGFGKLVLAATVLLIGAALLRRWQKKRARR